MISGKRHCCWVFQMYLFGTVSTTIRAPFTPIILEKRQKSLQPISPKLTPKLSTLINSSKCKCNIKFFCTRNRLVSVKQTYRAHRCLDCPSSDMLVICCIILSPIKASHLYVWSVYVCIYSVGGCCIAWPNIPQIKLMRSNKDKKENGGINPEDHTTTEQQTMRLGALEIPV